MEFNPYGDPPQIGHALPVFRVEGMDYDAWLEARKNSCGASEAAAIIGMNKYRSALDVWMTKRGLTTSHIDSLAMRQGTYLEPFIRSEFERETGLTVIEVPWCLSHPDEPRMTATLDGVTVDNFGNPAVVELKNPSWRQAGEWKAAMESGWPPADTSLESYFIQVICQMAVTGLDTGYLVGLVSKQLFVLTLKNEGDVAQIADLLPLAVGKFWREHVDANVAPEAGHKDAHALAELFPANSEDQEDVEAPDMEAYFAELDDLKEEISRLEKQRDTIVSKIKQRMGAAPKMRAGRYTATWKTVTSNRMDTKSLTKAHPDIAEQFRTKTESRQFRSHRSAK